MSASSTLGSGEKRMKKSALKEGKGKGGCGAGGIMRPALTFGFVRSAERTNSDESIDSPPSFSEGHSNFPCSSRPRREAALKGRCYTFGDESEDEDLAVGDADFDGAEDAEDNISTPAARDAEEEGFECHVMEAAGMNHESAVASEPHVPSDLWTMEEGRGGGGFGDDGAEEDEHSESLADDVLGGIYGHMSHSRDSYLNDNYELGGAGGASAGTGTSSEAPVLDGEEGAEAGAGETDEARWIRRTYETVYNPAARQRALQALTSDLGGQKTFSLPPPGRYPLDEGELFFLSSSRALAARDGEKPAAGAATATAGKGELGSSPSDGSDLSYFLQSHGAASKFARAEGGETAAKKCTVVYDFQ
jgi:hypothetical protein